MEAFRLTHTQRKALKTMIQAGGIVKINRRTANAIERAGIRLGWNSEGTKVWPGEEDRAEFAANTGLVHPRR